MKKLNWGDTLCGHEVKPDDWDGGICTHQGRWGVNVDTEGYTTVSMQATPIYPPRGWNGLDEEEIWAGMTDFGKCYITYTYALPDGKESYVTLQVDVNYGGRKIGDDVYVDIWSDSEGVERTLYPVRHTNLAALIQALQNAQVLSERLK